MNTIPFPASYKKAVLAKRKTMTVRVGDEKGKYKAGNVYATCSYSGTDWGTVVRIVSVIRMRLADLPIPKQSVASLQRKTKLSKNDEVEIVRFCYA